MSTWTSCSCRRRWRELETVPSESKKNEERHQIFRGPDESSSRVNSPMKTNLASFFSPLLSLSLSDSLWFLLLFGVVTASLPLQRQSLERPAESGENKTSIKSNVDEANIQKSAGGDVLHSGRIVTLSRLPSARAWTQQQQQQEKEEEEESQVVKKSRAAGWSWLLLFVCWMSEAVDIEKPPGLVRIVVLIVSFAPVPRCCCCCCAAALASTWQRLFAHQRQRSVNAS